MIQSSHKVKANEINYKNEKLIFSLNTDIWLLNVRIDRFERCQVMFIAQNSSVCFLLLTFELQISRSLILLWMHFGFLELRCRPAMVKPSHICVFLKNCLAITLTKVAKFKLFLSLLLGPGWKSSFINNAKNYVGNATMTKRKKKDRMSRNQLKLSDYPDLMNIKCWAF